MPFLAILQHDLRGLGASWLVRLWLAAAALLTLILTLSQWSASPSAVLISSLLFPYLVFPWFFVVIVLGVGPVSGSRSESLADGILSRPVSRWEYLLASWSSRVVLVLGAYLIVTVPAILLVVLANRPLPENRVPEDPVTVYGIIGALGAAGLVMTFQVSLGFLLGTLLRRPLLAVVVLVFIWSPITLILTAFSLEEFSPISLDRALPTLLRQPWREDPQEAAAGQELEVLSPEQELEVLSPEGANFLRRLSGVPVVPVEPVREESAFYESDDFEDFSLARVALGYGIPTLAAVALATLCFCWRDL